MKYKDLTIIRQSAQKNKCLWKALKNKTAVALSIQKLLNQQDLEKQTHLRYKHWENCVLPIEVLLFNNILYTEYELFLGDCCELIKGKQIHEWIEQFIIDVGNGLLQIHQDGYIHVDIQPANIVYKQDNNNYSFSICDFSSLLREEDTKNRQCVGSPSYMPQEINDKIEVQESGYTNAVDVWAFGVTLFELITLQDLFEDSTMSEKGNQQFVDQQIQIVQDEFYKAVLTKLLRVDPLKRPTIKEFLEFFQEPQNRIITPFPLITFPKLEFETLEEFFQQNEFEYYFEESEYPDFEYQAQIQVESAYPY